MFIKILIANRGEIACRVAATARRMGIKTVAVYSEADASAKHVAACDEATPIGPPAVNESYLRGDKIIAAALAAGAQAIHPGYGFLSENADFAGACAAAGLIFIGPPASAIRAMGSKSAAKSLMESSKLPLAPGYHGDNQDADFLLGEAKRIGYPVLLKPSAGGGGKGMRIVECNADFQAALASCKREAISSFGDNKVLLEKYLSRPRHIEIQVFADAHGDCVHLFERDCSVQRRHQKVLEEAPAPGMSPERRAAMGAAAVAAAKAIGYVGAGTVEFIIDRDGAFYFMEMNTRLQVEHPVTEMITGLDLVEWQLRVAAGERLPRRQAELTIDGHAIEARIYAENPDKGFLPSIGVVRYLHMPPAAAFSASGGGCSEQAVVRIDSGVRQGDAIAPFYDPMIAKLIVWGNNREQALARMTAALSEYQIVGPVSNIAFLQRLIASPAFADADLDTGLIERQRALLFPAPSRAALPVLALAAAALLGAESRLHAAGGDPWDNTCGWRLNGMLRRNLIFADEANSYQLGIAYRADGWTLEADGLTHGLSLAAEDGAGLTLRLGERLVHGKAIRDGECFHIFSAGNHTVLTYADPLVHACQADAEDGRLTAPMPGRIVAVLIGAGAAVGKGSPLLIMEAMKMEHVIVAPNDGVVVQLLSAVGDQVAEGAQLLIFKPIAESA